MRRGTRLYFVSPCAWNRIAHASQAQTMLPIGWIEQMLMVGRERSAAHLAALDRRTLARELTEKVERGGTGLCLFDHDLEVASV